MSYFIGGMVPVQVFQIFEIIDEIFVVVAGEGYDLHSGAERKGASVVAAIETGDHLHEAVEDSVHILAGEGHVVFGAHVQGTFGSYEQPFDGNVLRLGVHEAQDVLDGDFQNVAEAGEFPPLVFAAQSDFDKSYIIFGRIDEFDAQKIFVLGNDRQISFSNERSAQFDSFHFRDRKENGNDVADFDILVTGQAESRFGKILDKGVKISRLNVNPGQHPARRTFLLTFVSHLRLSGI